MKKVMMMLVTVLLMAACATLTPEEKAAREAAAREYVKTAVATQRYKINLNTMRPMRGSNLPITNAWLKADSNIVECLMPYRGLDDIPHLKTPGMVRDESKFEFKSEISDYVLNIQPAEERAIVSFEADNHGFECKFTIIIENSGVVKMHVDTEKRDFIDYEGYIVIPKLK